MSDDRKVYVVCRVVTFNTGERIMIPYTIYDDKSVAERVAKTRNEGVGDLFQNAFLAMPVATPEGVVLQDTGMKLGQFLKDLGIAQVGHGIAEQTVHTSDLLVPQKKIII